MGDLNWKSFNSKEDQTDKISNSVFVTNFPDHVCARDLWKVCNDYGSVVDVYIPFKRSKAGKHFAFIRFIKVTNLERLIENLRTIWIGSFHLHANMVRFKREQKTKSSFPIHDKRPVLKEDAPKQSFPDHLKPALVLDDSCLKDRDFSMLVMGKVKDISAIPNLYIILFKEGFCSVNLTYLGGLWVLIALDFLASKQKFQGLPINSWTTNTFFKIASMWGDLVVWEDFEENSLSSLHLMMSLLTKNERRKYVKTEHENIKEDSEVDRVSESSCMHENVISTQHEETTQSKDPFNIYDLPRKNKDNVPKTNEADPAYPPGFTPEFEYNAKDKREDETPKHDNGSILEVMDDLVKMNFMSLNIPGIGHKEKKGWIKELCLKHRINFVTLQETKMESIDLFSIKELWGNLTFDHVISSSVGNSEKKELWGYIRSMIDMWERENVILGDFNEVRMEEERFGSRFNIQGSNAFNSFISMANLIDLPLGGYSYTWAHKSATKMSKVDRFLISKGLLVLFPFLTGFCLDRHLSDHRPILMSESYLDYGPTPFRMFHSWFKQKGFVKFVEDSWNSIHIIESNSMIYLKKKFQLLKYVIKDWSKENKRTLLVTKAIVQNKLLVVDKIIDQNGGNVDILKQRSSLLKDLQDISSVKVSDLSQKAKVRWAIEGDENSKYFYGILNKKRSQLAIRGILFPSRLNIDQIEDLECVITYDEIKNVVWECGKNKSLGPDGFSFEFFCKFWNLIDQEVVAVVSEFLSTGKFPHGCNSSFIALIPKIQDVKVVKDYRLISLIGSMYKIIAKILAIRLSLVMPDLISDVQSAFVSNRQILDGPFILNELLSWCMYKKVNAMIFKVDFEKAFDFVRWDYLNDVLNSFGFGAKWRIWIRGCLNSAKGSVLVNGSPASEFHFYKGLKQGDPLSHFSHGKFASFECWMSVYSKAFLSTNL
ncbi:RNA-directed DNA polymerase, eukaryota [Tanacetum coccineum]